MPLKKLIFPSLFTLCILSAFLIFADRAEPERNFIRPVDNQLLIIGHLTATEGLNFASDVALLQDDSFTKVSGVPTFGFSDSKHWLRLRVLNFENRDIDRILEVTNPILNECNLYEVEGGQSYALFRTGDQKEYKERPIDHRNFQFPIRIEANKSKELLLRVSSEGEQLQVPLKLWEKTNLDRQDGTDRLLRGIYFGIILFVLIFNLFLYIIIHDKSSLFYVIYIFALLMLQLSLSGFAFEYLWPESTYLANIANPFFASISIFALIRFTQTFLNLKEFYPRIYKSLHIMGALVAANSLLALIHTPFFFKFSVLSINVMALILNIAIIPIVVAVVKKQFRPAKYFLIAFIVLVGSVFFFILNNFGIIYSDFYAAYGLQIGSAIEVILLSFAIVDKFKLFREKSYERLKTINNMKAKANEKLEKEVVIRTREISEQKQVVEQQKDEILDSIRYAERIQKSLLPSDDKVKRIFQDHFILFKPRDIVSGDFYWVGETSEAFPWQMGNNLKLFAAVDCTGHGVPGAMMSMLGYQALEQCTLRSDLTNPAEALNFINNAIVTSLNEQRDGDIQVKDGMDMVLCAYHEETRTLSFAGAKNSMYIVRSGELIELKGDRISIGSGIIENANEGFTVKTVVLEENDSVYTFTDGFPDQFGGPKEKKLKSKNLLDFILELSHEKMENQKAQLAEFFSTWKGEAEQIDDVCLMGIRIH
ncbi:MAG TPA: 7TM diverse intracellular signaling domain-containing protein [Cryomorphaceae bacterium]|nr:7TM diverse intracellular signaling domain-containing protein [Cryomorphaceae bacterium]